MAKKKQTRSSARPRPKPHKTDVIVTKEISGFHAIIPSIKGGSSVDLFVSTGERLTVYFSREGRYQYINRGELEALVAIYDQLQEIK